MNVKKTSGAKGALSVTSLEVSGDQRAKIDSLLVRWNIIQGQLKRAEQISQAAVMPAVNELRYAGRMLVGVMSQVAPSPENGLLSLDDAIVTCSQYLTNAEHDISDALIYFYQKKVDDLNIRYGADAITKQFEDYGVINSSLKVARNLVIASRSDLAQRQGNYEELKELTDKITEKYFVLADSEVLFALEVEYYQSQIYLWKLVAGAAAIAAVIFSILHFSQ